MRHYDISRWSDFARGLVKGTDRTAMVKHLEAGCKQCRRASDVLGRFAKLAQGEAEYQVPQSLVHWARSILVMQRPEKSRGLARLAARLIFDSFRDPLPAGVRSRPGSSPQVLFQAGDFSLDLRLDFEPGTPRPVLVGQIANFKNPSMEMSHVPVFLVRDDEVIARAVSNSLGEFQMEYQEKSRLRVCLPVRESGRRIEVSLNRLVAGASTNKITVPTVPVSKKNRT